MTKPILVGYDPRTADRAPVEFGVAAARFTGAPLVVASVQTGVPVVPISVGQSLPYGIGQIDEDLLRDCTEMIDALEADLTAAGISVSCRKLQSTSAARALHEAAEEDDAGLLVVGSSRRSSAGRVLAGSTAMRLLHGAPCPVAVVPQTYTARGGPETIGVAYVNSEEGREALRGAHALARRAGATLRVLTVVKLSPSAHLEEDAVRASWQPEVKDWVDVEGHHRIEAERELRRVVAALADDVPVEVDAFVGDPAEVIVEVSKGLDLLVCGSRGYGPARAVLLGSVSRRVTAEAHCPVVVLPRGVEASLEALVAESPGATAPV
jgi:nucleotide-binding universal stress UspA family protein